MYMYGIGMVWYGMCMVTSHKTTTYPAHVPKISSSHTLVPHRVPGRAMSKRTWSTGAIEFDASRCKMRYFDGRDSTALAPTARLTQAPLLLRPLRV